MIIPVRVPTHAKTHTVGNPITLTPDHSLHSQPCPACDNPFAYRPIILVYVGADPHDRARAAGSKYMTGAAVAVHADCASAVPPDLEGQP